MKTQQELDRMLVSAMSALGKMDSANPMHKEMCKTIDVIACCAGHPNSFEATALTMMEDGERLGDEKVNEVIGAYREGMQPVCIKELTASVERTRARMVERHPEATESINARSKALTERFAKGWSKPE